ncbi:hypothetical protein LQZ19_07945 [Treponema primitia]|uniref:hypothetical protein n=1 Tax=Treponema primitia TaxID=88058 RepID=UPI00397F74CF
MNVQGRDCCITLKTPYRAIGLPYAEETIREAISLLKEEAPIEGAGNCRAIRKSRGVTGCVVTPLTIETAPLLFVLALGRSGLPVFVSGTRNLYRHSIRLSAMEMGLRFDLIQERGSLRTLYEGCSVRDFELRILRDEAIKLKLDIAGDIAPATYLYQDSLTMDDGERAFCERFKEDGVQYRINGAENKTIYGLTIAGRKQEGTQMEVWIHRILDTAGELPTSIESLEIQAHLFRDSYEWRSYGAFYLTLTRLVLMADETNVDSGDAVIGPLRYYVTGTVSAEVFTTDEGIIE